MTTDYTLPPVPDHPEPRHMRWTDLEIKAIADYGQACAEAAREPPLAENARLLARLAESDEYVIEANKLLGEQSSEIDRLRAEVEALRKAAVEVAMFAKPNYSTSRHASVRKGHSLSGELLHYTVRPDLFHKLKQAAQRGEGDG